MEEQASILRSLLAGLENKEVDEESGEGLTEEFLRLKQQSIQYRRDNTYPTKAALNKDNIKKNRYKDIVAFDHTRVKLSLTTSKNDEDYINASFIKGVSGSRAYIATQGPLPHTVLDFLRMVWEYDIKVLVMACREFEMGRKKCECYWPEKETEPFVCGHFTIYCDNDEYKGDYRTRKLRITYQNCSRTLHQLHYINWPDHGVPDSLPPILDMLQEMRSYQDHDQVPICIHCSAGCGRTGVLCAIDYTWNLVKRQLIPADFSIYELVQHMRTQRPSVVQTKEQYAMVYKTIKFLFEKYLQSFDMQACQNWVQPTASSSPTVGDSEFSDLSDVSESDLKRQAECRLGPESQPRSTLLEERDPVAQRTNYKWLEEEEEEEQVYRQVLHYQQQLAISQSTSMAATSPQEELNLLNEFPKVSKDHGLIVRPTLRLEVRIEEEVNVPQPNHTVPLLATCCVTMEDPYFESPESSPSAVEAFESLAEDSASTAQHRDNTPGLTINDLSPGNIVNYSDNGLPSPLPAQTPESCILGVDSEGSESGHKLEIIIPPNAAAIAIREMRGPPSPVPTLPERTPESFELVPDEASLNRIGVSSEWCCGSTRAPTQNEHKPWTRSKSLRASTSLTALLTVACPVSPSKTRSLLLPPPLPHLPPPLHLKEEPSLQADETLNPPLPQRTPESFILATQEDSENSRSQAGPATSPVTRIGTSSEWAGSSPSKTFLDLFMNRSKSVRAKGSRQEPLAAARQLAPPSGWGSAEEEQRVNSVRTETSNDKDHSNGKITSRTRCLKLFQYKAKYKTAPPPVPYQSEEASTRSSLSVFKFGFGNRFLKPKGPRRYPDSWL